jgi:hypothetical protein
MLAVRYYFWCTVGGLLLAATAKAQQQPVGPSELLKTRYQLALQKVPRRARTRLGLAGDPINLALVCTEKQLVQAMLRAGWLPADPITFSSSVRIAASTIFHRPYPSAPVSNLYVGKRKQDLAFEQLVGKDARRRHHVRFWLSGEFDADGRPIWLGAATFDSRVEISRTTGLLTHRIAPEVDAERDKVLNDLRTAGTIERSYWIAPFQEKLKGRNGGGDPYFTDGRLAVGVLQDKDHPLTN